MPTRLQAGLLAAMIATLSPARATAAQDQVAMAGAPRFLRLAPDSRTLEAVDVSRTAALRQRVSLNRDRQTVAQLLASISRQTGLDFAYNADAVNADRVVLLKAQSITVAAALTEILADAGVDVLLRAGRQVALMRRGASVVRSGGVTGRVTDAGTGAKLAGVDVFLEGTKRRAVTDSSGRYTLGDVDAGRYTLTARRLGYAKQSQVVTVQGNRVDTVDVAMTPVAARLDELVSTATGQQRRRDLGNAITTIRADSVLRSAPIRSLTDLLENRVPGMSLQHTSGAPGDPARIRLRGLSSVMRGNDPVVVVDGIRVYSAQSEARSGNLTNLNHSNDPPGPNRPDAPAPSPLDQIDPNIIETIEVFKGPSAATLYGADAANGVIVITTKKGKPGPARWNASIEHGRTTPAGRYPEGYYRWGHAPTIGAAEVCPLVYVRCVQDSLVRFQALNDPETTIFGEGRRTALSLAASGGSQALTYRVTGSYGDETGLLKLPEYEVGQFRKRLNREAPEWARRPHRFKEWSVTSNVTALLGATADVGLTTTLSRSEQQRSSLEEQQARLAGTYLDRVNGQYYQPIRTHQLPGDNTYYLYPFGTELLSEYYRRTTASTITFTTGLSANWRPRSWLTATGRAGLNVTPRDDESLVPGGLRGPADSGLLIRGTGRAVVSTFDLNGTLRRPLRWGFVFETNVGANLVTQSTNDLVSSAAGLVPGTSSLSGAARFSAVDSRVNTSVFGWHVEPRLTGQRLSLSMGIRLDGGSAYGTRVTTSGGRGLLGLLALPKLNGSWVISEEPWFPFNNVFSSLRLRGAYGQAQVQPGATDRLRIYTRMVDGGGEALDLTGLGNTDLRPERSTEFEGGFDADLLDGRVSVELTAYRKLQVDALMPVQLPNSVNGGGAVIKNIGNIRNTGVELVAGVTPVRSPLLTWSTTVNYHRNTNTLTRLGTGVESNPRTGVVAGYPVGGRWTRPILGFADVNGDGVIEAGEVQVGDSLVFTGRLLPAYKASFFTNLALLGGTVGVTAGFSYDAGGTQIDQTAKTNWVLSRALFDPTTPMEQQAAVVVTDSTDYGITQTVSTFRFNSLSVRYRAPAGVARLLGSRELSIALQGSNLGMHSTYRGKDPDVTAWSPSEHVVDTGQLALPRTWQLRLDLDF